MRTAVPHKRTGPSTCSEQPLVDCAAPTGPAAAGDGSNDSTGRRTGSTTASEEGVMDAASQLPVTQPAPGARWRNFDVKWVAIGICVAIVAYLALIPLGFLLWQSFFTPRTASKAAEFTLGNYRTAYSSAETW